MSLRERWERVRCWTYESRGSYGGAVSGWVEIDLGELPLPRPWVYFEEQCFAIGVTVGNGHREQLATVAIDLHLPAPAADALVVVWPGRCEPGARWAALGRLCGRDVEASAT